MERGLAGVESQEARLLLQALDRPFPLETGLAAEFIERSQGHATAAFPHPMTEPILAGAYGLLIWREQAHQILTALGFDERAAKEGVHALSGAPQLQHDREALRQRFLDAAGGRMGLKKAEATRRFDWFEKWAPGAFPRSLLSLRRS